MAHLWRGGLELEDLTIEHQLLVLIGLGPGDAERAPVPGELEILDIGADGADLVVRRWRSYSDTEIEVYPAAVLVERGEEQRMHATCDGLLEPGQAIAVAVPH